MTKTCSKCKAQKPLEDFNQRSALKSGRSAYCRSCAQSTALIHYRKRPDRQAAHRIIRTYKLSPEQFLHWQKNANGLCEMCGKPERKRPKGKIGVGGVYEDFYRLAVDHDHGTGKFRGLLCHSCNMVQFPDDIAFLKLRVAYLERHQVRSGDELPLDSSWMLH